MNAELALAGLRFDEQGLIPVIAQDHQTKQVLMFAFMNRESLALSIETGYAVYWSRSRQRLWYKGEESGHQQKIHAINIDCDADVVLLTIEQIGGIACHTGRCSCFFNTLDKDSMTWQINAPVIKDPKEIYIK